MTGYIFMHPASLFCSAKRQTSLWHFLEPISTVARCDEVKHFTDDARIDVVRRVMPRAEAALIQEHLNDACEAYAIWRTAAEVASRESHYHVPQQTVRMLEAAYADLRRTHIVSTSARVARLVSDSFLEPLPSGVRTAFASTRRILCLSGEWAIDMRLEQEPGNRVFLAGQVLRWANKAAHDAEMEVTLMSADTLLTQACTNRFGEFQMEFDCAQNLHMHIDIPGRQPIAVSIPGSDDSTEESASEQSER
jgi:hypothetical protein